MDGLYITTFLDHELCMHDRCELPCCISDSLVGFEGLVMLEVHYGEVRISAVDKLPQCFFWMRVRVPAMRYFLKM